MSSNDIHHLAAAYALDAVDERERSEFEAHYEACEVCTLDVAEFRATLAVVAAAQATPPAAAVKERVMADIANTRQHSPLVPARAGDLTPWRELRRRRMTSGLLAAAAAIVLVVAGVLAGRGLGDGGGFGDAAAAVFERTDTRVVDLAGPGTGAFRVAWSPSAGRAVVLGDGLVDPGGGKAYELWLIDGGGAHAMGLLDGADDGRVRRVLDVDGAPVQWGVTIERASGADTPTEPILFAGAA